ncbi:MAG: alpha/beta hydrolase [Clostridia bacterium]|nr:alpha/beta hydrolase [Clostridia bacterium]
MRNRNKKTGKRGRIVLICVVLAVVIVLLLVGFYFAQYSMTGYRQTLEEARAWQEQHCDLSWYDTLEKNEYTVTSYDGYVLHAEFLKNPEDTDRYILISHGYTDNRFGAYKYASMYLNQGFNVIAYDLRGHGLNEPTFCTYSVRERKDLSCMIMDSRTRYPDAKLFGIHGESLGAATSIAVLDERPEIDFVVADCGFSEIASVLRQGIKSSHLPTFLVDVASLCAKIRYGYSYGEMQPIQSLRENRIPILFIHGAEDTFILPEHSERMKEATKGYAELHLIPGAGHAESILTDPEAYSKYVADFLLSHVEN